MGALIKFVFKKDPDGRLHCWNRHFVSAEDVKFAFLDPTGKLYKEDGEVYSKEGITANGQTLRIFFLWFIPKQKVYIITAYPI